MILSLKLTLLGLLAASLTEAALVPFKGKVPELPQGRKPFGYGIQATGGAANRTNVYIATNMVDLRDALQLNVSRTVYVKGNIDGSVRFNNITGKNEPTNCNTYIQENAPQFNFTQYMMSLNTTYMASLKALPLNSTVEGTLATDFIALLEQQVVGSKFFVHFIWIRLLILSPGMGRTCISCSKQRC